MKQDNKTRVRNQTLNLRVSQEEKAALKTLAAAAGTTITGYLLGLALGEMIAGGGKKEG